MIALQNTLSLKPGDTVLTRLGPVVLLDRHERTDVDGQTVVWFTSAGLQANPNAVLVQGTEQNLWPVQMPAMPDTAAADSAG